LSLLFERALFRVISNSMCVRWLALIRKDPFEVMKNLVDVLQRWHHGAGKDVSQHEWDFIHTEMAGD